MNPQPSNAHPPLQRARRVSLLLFALLIGGAGVRAYVNSVHAESVKAGTKDNAFKSVLTTKAKAGKGSRTVALPATLRGQNEAAIHARTNGYVRAWKKDIGDLVKKGDVLAIIDTPEVDQDLAQAKASLEQVKARLTLAQSSLVRWEGLRERDAVSQQELDERRATHQQAQADLTAAQANVARLQQLHDFGVITAPFDGVVVRRNVDVGALIASGSATNTKELYYLAQTDALRLTVAVPQAYAADVTPGKEVSIKLLERPNLPVKGQITRVSGGVDVATRSVLVEVTLPNKDGQLLPGAYVEVSLPLSGTAQALLLSPQALQFRQDGPRVAVVGEGGKVSLRSVKLGRDLGLSIEVLSGISPKDAVMLNPHDSLEEGEVVLAREAPTEKTPPKADGAASKPAKGGKA